MAGTLLERKMKYVGYAMCFWIGVGLMSIVNVIKLTYTQTSLPYSWIMFWISVAFIVICLVLLAMRKKS